MDTTPGIIAPSEEYKGFEIINGSNGFQFDPTTADKRAWVVVRDLKKNIVCNFNFVMSLIEGTIPYNDPKISRFEIAINYVKELIDYGDIVKSKDFTLCYYGGSEQFI